MSEYQRGWDFSLTMSKWNIYLARQFIQWMPKVLGDILAIWVKAFGLMEITDSGVNTSIPRACLNPDKEFQRGIRG
jgi:hypothetical protein